MSDVTLDVDGSPASLAEVLDRAIEQLERRRGCVAGELERIDHALTALRELRLLDDHQAATALQAEAEAMDESSQAQARACAPLDGWAAAQEVDVDVPANDDGLHFETFIPPHARPRMDDVLPDVLVGEEEGLTPTQILVALRGTGFDWSMATVTDALARLRVARVIERPRRGLYRLVDVDRRAAQPSSQVDGSDSSASSEVEKSAHPDDDPPEAPQDDARPTGEDRPPEAPSRPTDDPGARSKAPAIHPPPPPPGNRDINSPEGGWKCPFADCDPTRRFWRKQALSIHLQRIHQSHLWQFDEHELVA